MRLGAMLLLVVSLLLTAGSVCAQDKGDIGLVAASSSSVGVIWHATSWLAVDTVLSLSKGSGSSNGSFASTSDSWAIGIDVSARFRLARKDNLIPYLAPAFSYDRTRNSTSSTGSVIGGVSTSTTTTGVTHGVGGALSFGLQYVLNSRFSIFGESGADYRRGTSDLSSVATIGSSGQNHIDVLSSRSRVGVTFYF